jgi:hypothetical protein
VTLAWGLIAAWSALILYVIVDVRRVMAFNGKWNARLGNSWPTGVTERGVQLNRVALVLLLIVSNALLVRFLL